MTDAASQHSLPLRGIIPPLPTPLRDGDTLDVEGLQRLLDHVIAGGVHGVFILGTTGEGPSLGYRLRRQLISEACRHVAGRVPVLVGISDSAFVESLAVAQHAAEAGADLLVAAPPFYHPAEQSELLRYVEHLAAALPLPLLLYNMPSHTKLTWGLDLMQQVIANPAIVGMKDSSGDMVYFRRLQRLAADRPQFTLLVGPEELLPDAVMFGGHGGVCGGANVNPRLFVDLYEAASAGDVERVRTGRERVAELGDVLRNTVGGASGYLRSLKATLAIMNICEAGVAEPFAPLTDAQREKLTARLDALALLDRAPR